MESQPPKRLLFIAPTTLILELLAWLAARTRSYSETMEAWRTSCPRMPVWEDATMSGLVAVVPGEEGMREAAVCLTPEGRAFLEEHAA